MYDLTRFSSLDMMKCRSALRAIREEKLGSMEVAAQRVIDHLFENLTPGKSNEPACALARLFITHPYGELTDDMKTFADRLMPGEKAPGVKCLTMLATRGIQPDWNSRHTSAGHKAIPLLSEKMVEKAPMVSQLLKQLGIPVRSLLNADESLILNEDEKSFNVFHVAEAAGSPYIPAQNEFVIPHRVVSVLGFGGLLPSGNLFATILFSRVPIAAPVAANFAPLALTVKLCLLPYSNRIFDS
jgi:hypothetical protein